MNVTANNMVMSVAKYGHKFAMSAASSNLTPAAGLSELFAGITQVRILYMYMYVHRRMYLYIRITDLPRILFYTLHV